MVSKKFREGPRMLSVKDINFINQDSEHRYVVHMKDGKVFLYPDTKKMVVGTDTIFMFDRTEDSDDN